MWAIKRFRKLKPAARVSQAELSKALDHIRARVAGEISLEKALAEFDPRLRNRSNAAEEPEARLPLNVKLATGLFEAGRITEAEFVFHCGFHIVGLHENITSMDFMILSLRRFLRKCSGSRKDTA